MLWRRLLGARREPRACFACRDCCDSRARAWISLRPETARAVLPSSCTSLSSLDAGKAVGFEGEVRVEWGWRDRSPLALPVPLFFVWCLLLRLGLFLPLVAAVVVAVLVVVVEGLLMVMRACLTTSGHCVRRKVTYLVTPRCTHVQVRRPQHQCSATSVHRCVCETAVRWVAAIRSSLTPPRRTTSNRQACPQPPRTKLLGGPGCSHGRRHAIQHRVEQRLATGDRCCVPFAEVEQRHDGARL